MKVLKASLRRLEEYRVPERRARIKLDQNEGSVDVPGRLKEKILQRISSIPWNRYPSGQPSDLLERIGAYAGFDPEGILAGNGSNELIQTVICACRNPAGSVAFLVPGFSVYGRVASAMDAAAIPVPLTGDFRLDADAVIEKAASADVVFIDSPNNPTGYLVDLPEVRRIAKSVEGWVVVDEAYHEFCGKTVLPILEECGNIIILRTFSKALSLAGFRLGYLMADPSTVRQLRKVRLPFSVGMFQQTAGSLILEDEKWIRRRISAVIREREHMFREMMNIRGIHAFPSQGNFILFTPEVHSAGVIWEGLLDRGILIRRFDTPRLDNMLRVSVGSPGENREFLHALSDLTRGRGE